MAAPNAQVAATASRLHTVTSGEMAVVVRLRGELQAVNNIELICKVEGRTTITEIAPEGASVRAGDTLIVLDSAAIRQAIEDARIELERAQLAQSNAEGNLAIQISNNAADIETAEVQLELAKLELRKFEEGTFPQNLSSAQTRVSMAKIDLQNKLDELSQTKVLFARGFVTAAEVKRQELAVTSARNTLVEAETALDVLNEYSFHADLASRRNAVTQAVNRLERTQRQSEQAVAQRHADLAAANQQLDIRKRRVDHLESQLLETTITAPTDGLVVYVNNRDQQTVIQQGAEVRERQAIIRLPDTTSMKAIIRVNEAQVTRIRPGQRASLAITGMVEPIGGTVEKVSVVADSGNRWWSPDTKEYPVELILDHTPAGLKPGLTANAEIFVESVSDALSIPVPSLFTAGRRSYVFLPKGDGFEPREVRLGMVNDTHAQVLSGLEEGDAVLMLEAGEGRRLLELAGVQLETPGPRRDNAQPGGERPARRPEQPAQPSAITSTPGTGSTQPGESTARPGQGSPHAPAQ
jgi:HlyD family secretion protein